MSAPARPSSPPSSPAEGDRHAVGRRLTTAAGSPMVRLAVFGLSLAIVAVLGAVHLPHPFHGDKALYQFGGRVLADGGILYVDFWDVKKPGIYLFHAVAGRVFGFSEIGVHLFELCWLLVLSACVVRIAAGWLERWWLAALAPVVTVGMYYGVANLWHLTQPAIVATLPLFLAMWLASVTPASPARLRASFAASGVAAGAAIAFKLALAPIPLAFWLVATALAVREGERPLTAARDRLLMGVLGAAAVLGVIAAWFWSRGALGELVASTISHPAEGWWELGDRRRARLGFSIRWFVGSVLPFLPFAALALAGWRGARRELPTLQLMAWGVAGGAAVLLEHYAWWPFDLLVLIVPVGLLALRGVDGAMRVLLRAEARHRPLRVAAHALPLLLLVATLPALKRWWYKAGPVLSAARSDDPDWMDSYRRSSYPPYEYARQRMAFLHAADALPGAIYVIGDPLYQLRSGRPQAIPVNGWAWETLPPERVREVTLQLQRAAPAYVFVETPYEPDIRRRAPELARWLEREYEQAIRDDKGTWHRRRAPAPAPASAP